MMGIDETATDRLRESLELSAKMLDLADRGVEGCQDDGCLLLYGIIRDSAYKIGAGAERELREHNGEGQEPGERAAVLTKRGGRYGHKIL